MRLQTSQLYPLSLHDALPISAAEPAAEDVLEHREDVARIHVAKVVAAGTAQACVAVLIVTCAFLFVGEHFVGFCSFFEVLFCFRSEEHTSELQSRENLVCRLL